MNKYRTLATNTLLLSIGTFGSKLLVFFMVRFYTGYLSPAAYGTADLITQTGNLLIPIVSLDITDAVFRFSADCQQDRADIFTVGLRAITCGGCVLLPLTVLLQQIPAIGDYALLLTGFVLASCYHALCAHFVRAQGDTALFAAQGLCNTALLIALNILFMAILRWGIRGYLTAITAANVLTTLLLVWRAKLWRYVCRSPQRSIRRAMLRYCVPLIPTAVFWWIMGVSDRYMVQYFLGRTATGLYAVAYKIPTVISILATVFLDAWQLSAITESHGDRQTHLQFFGKIWYAFAAALFLCASGIIAFSPLLIRILAEEAYAAAWRYLPALTLAMVASALSSFLGSVYVVTKNSVASFWTAFAGAAVNLAGNLWLIPRFGGQGAALATLASCLVVFLIRLVSARRLLPFPFSGRALALNTGVLLAQAAFLLFRWPGWRWAQLGGIAILFLQGLPPLAATAQVIFHRKQVLQ